jgi:hypothetical protein
MTDDQAGAQDHIANNAEDRALLKTAALGMDVDRFLSTPVGQHLLKRAQEEVHEGVSGLCNADAEDSKEIRKFQNQVWRGESIQQWLAEAIQEGIQAERIYQAPPDA